jgi:hypothetical protein
LDKTLAEYDTNGFAFDLLMKSQNNNTTTEITDHKNNSNKSAFKTTKILANDANAASIRTRVPTRKPGINASDIFTNNNINLEINNNYNHSPFSTLSNRNSGATIYATSGIIQSNQNHFKNIQNSQQQQQQQQFNRK